MAHHCQLESVGLLSNANMFVMVVIMANYELEEKKLAPNMDTDNVCKTKQLESVYAAVG